MTRERLFYLLQEYYEDYPEMILFDGLEDAVIGIARQFAKDPLLVYDRDKCIEILIERDGMSFDEAEEYFQFNTEGLWAGEGTPLIMVSIQTLEDMA